MLQGLAHCVLRDLIEGDAAYLFIGLVQLQGLHEMPADRLALAVRVRREIDLIRLFYFFSELGKHISLAPDRDILRLIAVLHIDPQL